jgi:hypothetical protein
MGWVAAFIPTPVMPGCIEGLVCVTSSGKCRICWGMVVCPHGLHAYEMLPWTTQDWQQWKLRELIGSRLRR